MAENLIDEDKALNELRSGPVVEVVDKKDEVINNENPTDTPPVSDPADPSGEIKEPTPSTDEPYWKQKGFTSQIELDAIIEASKNPRKAEYKTDFAREFDAFADATGKNDLNAFNFYKNTELKDSMTPQDYVKLIVEKEILDDPELAKFRDLRTKKLEEKFMLDMDESMDGITDEDRYEKMIKIKELKAEAESVINDIKTTREKMGNAGLTQEQIQANEAKLASNKTAWSDWTNKISKEFSINIYDEKKNEKGEWEIQKDSKGEPIVQKSFNLASDLEEQEFFKQALDGVIAQMGFPEPGSDSANIALDVAEAATWKRFRSKYIRAVMTQTRSDVMKEFNINADNPSILKPAEVTNKDGVISEEEAIRQWRQGQKG